MKMAKPMNIPIGKKQFNKILVLIFRRFKGNLLQPNIPNILVPLLNMPTQISKILNLHNLTKYCTHFAVHDKRKHTFIYIWSKLSKMCTLLLDNFSTMFKWKKINGFDLFAKSLPYSSEY